jgi:hypothetical protein
MNMADIPMSSSALIADSPSAATRREPTAFGTARGNPMMAWSDYAVDAVQRSVLFLDVLRRRGNAALEMAAHPTATVLRFQHEEIMSGRTLPRPMNYALSRIVPPRSIPASGRSWWWTRGPVKDPASAASRRRARSVTP